MVVIWIQDFSVMSFSLWLYMSVCEYVCLQEQVRWVQKKNKSTKEKQNTSNKITWVDHCFRDLIQQKKNNKKTPMLHWTKTSTEP